MTVIKQKILLEEEKYYSYPIKVYDENDSVFLDQSKTTGLISFGKKQIEHPKFWRGEKIKLPQNEYTIRKYEDIKFKLRAQELPYNDEGDRVELCADWYPHVHELDKVFPLVNYGGGSWQHFVQDNLPILSFAREFLIQNPDVYILCCNTPKDIRDYFFDKFDIKNPVIEYPFRYYLNRVEYSAKCNELYNFESNVQTPVFWWNNFFYKNISDVLWKGEKESSKSNLIYLKRNSNLSRRFNNELEVVDCLSKYAESNNLNLIVFESENYSIEERASIFRNAHTIVGPHGGANYHIIFSSKGTKFIEYTFIDKMYSLYNIASSLELDYYMVPNYGNNQTEYIDININKLLELLHL